VWYGHSYPSSTAIVGKADNTEPSLEDKLKQLCTEYSVYLRSDEYDKCHTIKNMWMTEEIAAAAMRLYHSGYDELIEMLEGENDDS